MHTQMITGEHAVFLVMISTLQNWLKFYEKFYLSVLSASKVKVPLELSSWIPTGAGTPGMP